MIKAQRRARQLHLKPIAMSFICAGSGAVMAQSPSTPAATPSLPEVRVTDTTVTPYKAQDASSEKFTAPLLDTPQTVNVIPKEVYNEQGARSLTDVLRNTPGISFNAGENGFGTNTNNFSLRGFDASGNIFIDGARDSGNYSRDPFNIEQVEVIKGPAADNGRGGAGGYINLQTKTPKLENFIGGSASYGFDSYDSDARRRLSVDLNRVLGETSAVRLNLLVDDSGVAGRKLAKQKTLGFAPSIAFGLGTPTSVVLSYQHVKQEDRPDWGVPGAFVKGTINYNPLAAQAGRDTFYGLASDYDDVTSDAFLARIEHKISPTLTISNQTRWSKTDRSALYTVPTGYTAATQLVPTQRQGFSRENTGLSNLTNLTAKFNTGSVKHTLATGLELTQEKSVSGRYPTNGVLGNPGNVSVFFPNPYRFVTGALIPTQTGTVKIRTIAAYAYDTVEFNPQWQLTGGLRVERYKVELASKTAIGAPQGGVDGYERSETSVSGKLGLVYKPARNGAIYVSYGQSAVPPGSWLSNPDSGREGDNAFPGWEGQHNRSAREQKLTNLEIGTKWDFLNDRLSATAAVFRTERKNVAMQAVNGTPSGYGKQSVQGLELGIAGSITPAWSIYGGLTLLDSERRHNAAVDAALSGDYGSYLTTNGDELAFTPKQTANLWTTYRFPIGLTVGGGFQRVGSSWVGRPDTADRVIPNGRAGKLPGYTVFNLMAAYELNKNVNLRLNIDNVGDKTYAQSMNWAATRAFLGAPRTVVVSADVKF